MKTGRYSLEKNTTVKFIIPLFSILGWDPFSKEMEFEYPVLRAKSGKSHSDHVDIALYINNNKKPRIIVEIKPILNDLTRGSQLLRYLQNARISQGIYTNGKEIKLISMQGVRHGFSPRVLFHLKNLDDFIEYKEVLWLFSKESFKKNKIEGGGYCASWSMFFAEACLKNPNMSSAEVLENIYNYLTTKPSAEDYLRKVIRGYTGYLVETVNKYLEIFFKPKITVVDIVNFTNNFKIVNMDKIISKPKHNIISIEEFKSNN
jgi:hypothetical protein